MVVGGSGSRGGGPWSLEIGEGVLELGWRNLHLGPWFVSEWTILLARAKRPVETKLYAVFEDRLVTAL
jgi:hypothetical protein